MSSISYIEIWEEKDDKKLLEIFKTVGGRNLVSTSDFLQELRIREQAKQTNTLKRLTWWIFGFTLVVTLAMLLNLAITLKWIG